MIFCAICAVAGRQVMPLVERVVDRSNTLVTARTKKAFGSSARDLISRIGSTVQQAVDPKVLLGVFVSPSCVLRVERSFLGRGRGGGPSIRRSA